MIFAASKLSSYSYNCDAWVIYGIKKNYYLF